MMRRRSKSLTNLVDLPTPVHHPLRPISNNNILKRNGLATVDGPIKKNPRILPVFQSASKIKPATTTNRNGTSGISGTRLIQRTKCVEKKIPTASKAPIPSKATLSKPAPYDFQARWKILNEKHNTLIAEHKETVKKNQDLNNKVTELANIQNMYENLELKYIQQKSLIVEKENELTSVKARLNFCTSQLEIFESKLNAATNALKNLETVHGKLELKHEMLEHKYETLEMKLETTEEQNQQLRTLLQQSDIDRRRLQNLIQDLKGNIRVFCRVRPILEHEKHKVPVVVNYVDESTMEVYDPSQKVISKQEFVFDRVFGPRASQELVFEELGQLVESALDGYNVCVFAYGQTGSGKTFTMEGNREISELAGMIPRTADLIFKSVEIRRQLDWKIDVQISFLEIYNEHIIDLLGNSNRKENYEIRMIDPKGSDLYVTNLKIEKITSSAEVLMKLATAQENRTVAATTMNAHSSRSHCVGKIYLTGLNKRTKEKFTSSLSLVDLAGSERLHHATDAVRLTETKNINKSLANLGNVILALSQKNKHIPFRNSKLTHLLMPSLSGSSKMLMFVNVSPLASSYNETLNSLRFASNVNSTKIGIVRKNKVQMISET